MLKSITYYCCIAHSESLISTDLIFIFAISLKWAVTAERDQGGEMACYTFRNSGHCLLLKKDGSALPEDGPLS